MLICDNDKCKTEETTRSAARKQVSESGIVHRCPGCGGYLRDPARDPVAEAQVRDARTAADATLTDTRNAEKTAELRAAGHGQDDPSE